MYGDAKWTVVGTTGFTVCGTGAVAVAGIEVTANGFKARDAAWEVRTLDGASVHLNVGKAGCTFFDALGEVIALIVPNTTALAAPNAPAVAIDRKRVTALIAEPGVCAATVGCADAASC